jgi:hypothetical protein
MEVRLDGQLIGKFQGQSDLKNGKTYRLAGGSILNIALVPGIYRNELRVTLNGKTVPGSGGDPGLRARAAIGVLYFIGGLDLLIGLFSILFDAEMLRNLGIGPYHIVVGLIFVVLAFLAQRQTPYVVWVAAAIFVVDSVIGVVTTLNRGLPLSTGGLIFRAILLATLVQAIPVMDGLKKAEG